MSPEPSSKPESSTSLLQDRFAEVAGVYYRGLCDYLYYLGVPYYKYRIMGPKTLIVKAPVVSRLRIKP